MAEYIMTPSSLSISSEGGQYAVSITTDGQMFDLEADIPSSLGGDYEVDNHYSYAEVIFTFPRTTSEVAKVTNITITIEDIEGDTETLTLTCVQDAHQMGEVKPIGKPYIKEFTTSSSVDYAVTSNGETIYKGKAYAMPGAEVAKVRIDDICHDLVSSSDDLANEGFRYMDDYKKEVVVKSGSATTAIAFVNDWSGENRTYTHHTDLSAPIDGVIDSSQLLCHTEWVTSVDEIPIYVDGEDDYIFEADKTGAVLFCQDVDNYAPSKTLTIGLDTYKVKDGHDYVLHYVNAYGGWDSFAIYGHAKRKDKVVKSQFKNGNETQVYKKEITTSWTLHTGILTDDQSKRMHHLLESCKVVLEDLRSDHKLTPVYISADSVDHKTYASEGNKAYYYTIEVTEAYTKTRR